MNEIRNMNDTDSENLKLIILHINDTQVRLLEKFFEKIGIYYYTVEEMLKELLISQLNTNKQKFGLVQMP